VEIYIHNLRDYSKTRYKQVDDYAFGGGAGMVLMAEPIADCIETLKGHRTYDEIIFMCPDGEVFNQKAANSLSLKENIIILCGHYKGVDERIRKKYITREISVGDYVLTGGELAAAIVVDAIVRLIPGAIGDEESALSDSFQDGLLAPPVYTRPEDFRGMKVPNILMSGDHKKIEEWRHDESMRRTQERRPDLL
jgi:tRNA (guanine37-N1)-methyltransferase